MYGIPQPPKGQVTYVIKVLWMHGMSIGNVAGVVGRTPGSVRGIVSRAMEKARDEMTIDERRAALAILQQESVFASQIPAKFFEPAPLSASQGGAAAKMKAAAVARPTPFLPSKPKVAPEVPANPEPRTNSEKRKEAARQRREEARLRKLEEEQRKARELGGAERGIASASLEWLHATNVLSDPEERGVEAGHAFARRNELSSKERRKEAGRILRDYIDGSRVGGISAIDLDRVGTGSNSRLSIPEFRLRCMSAIGAIRTMLGQQDYAMIEGVVDHDATPWKVASERGRAKIYEDVRRCLDAIAVHERLMERDTFRERWNRDLAFVHGMSRDQAREVSETAHQLLRGAA